MAFMTTIQQVAENAARGHLRAALSDEHIELIQEALRIALDAKRKALETSRALAMNLKPEHFGIPDLESLVELLQSTYDEPTIQTPPAHSGPCEWGPRTDGDPEGEECRLCGDIIPF